MSDPVAHALGGVMLAFEGHTVPPAVRRRLAEAPAAGFTLFRFANVASPTQVRALTDDLQRAAGSHRHGGADPPGRPLLIAADQEGGQFLALGDGTTPFAGNMALGAAGDVGLAERVGAAIGTELRALGVNVCYAPDLDIATNPGNPGLGIRSFGDDPARVAELGAAWIRGLRSAGVAATAKHFPGKGDVAVDTHHDLGIVRHGRERFEAVELRPFRAAIEAGVDLVMSGHFAVPGLTGDGERGADPLPATLDGRVMRDLLRRALGFEGVTITDALDMRALPQGDAQVLDTIAARRAGVDLLLTAIDAEAQARIEGGLEHAARRGLLDPDDLERSAARVDRLRAHLGAFPDPAPSVVGSAAHLALARELAQRSITLVRDEAGLLPLRLSPGQRILAVMPAPRNLTPADTSSTVSPGLAAALRTVHPSVDEIVTSHPPTDREIAGVREAASRVDVVVVGTIAASLEPAPSPQAALVRSALEVGVPTVTVALRTPWDLLAYPEAGTHLATYGLLPPTIEALARALIGEVVPEGRLPVRLGPVVRPEAGAAYRSG